MLQSSKSKQALTIICFILGIFFSRSIDVAASQTIISQEEAEQIALEAVSGTIIRTELDHDGVNNMFYVYILSGVNLKEIYINAQTGEIMSIDNTFLPLVIGGIAVVGVGIVWFLRKRKKS